MKTHKDEKHGYEIDLQDDWTIDNYKPPIFTVMTWLFRVTQGWTPKVEMAYVRGSDKTIETINISVDATAPTSSPETIKQMFRIYAQQSGYTNVSFGKILVGGTEHVWARYQIAKNAWSKKYMIVLNGTGYAITTFCKDVEILATREAEWDSIASSLRLLQLNNNPS